MEDLYSRRWARVLNGIAEQQANPAAVYATAQIPPPAASRAPTPMYIDALRFSKPNTAASDRSVQ